MTTPRRWRWGYPRSASNVRAALLIGFTLVFGLWLVWGVELVRGLRQIEENVARVHDAYLGGERAISAIRTDVLLASVYVRDLLIDPSPGRSEELQPELSRLRTEVEGLLLLSEADVESEVDREQWGRLRVALGDYWASREAALAAPIDAAEWLRGRLAPQRDSVLQILDQLSVVQAATIQRQRGTVGVLYQRARVRLFAFGSAALLVALLAAVLASRYVYRLQGEVDRQRLVEQRNREDLERLSARLVEVQEQDRRRLARELHDEVGQALTAVRMDIGIALRTNVDERARSALTEARDLSESTLRSVRDMSQLLHPSVLDDFGLPATLRTYLRHFTERTGIRVQLAEALEARLPSDVELCVYRIVQEALNNVAKHSGATACTVTLTGLPGLVRLAIEDNGRGVRLSERPATEHGLGLIGMRERAQALRGGFAIGDRDGGGTVIRVALPLDSAVAAGGSEDTSEETARRAG